MKEGIKTRLEMINRGEVPEGYKKTKVGIIPEDWEVKKLGEISEVINGGTPSTKIESYWNGEIPWCTPTDITSSKKYIEVTDKYITEKGLNNSSAILLPINSILMCSRATIGPRSINKVPMATNQGFKSFICKKDDVYFEFLYYLLDIYILTFVRKSNGSTFLEISKHDVEQTEVLIPKLYEQEKIAQVLSTWDKAIELKEKLIEEKKQQKKGLMQKLLTGEIRLAGFDGEWEEVRLGEVLDFPRKKAVPNPQDYYLLTVRLHLKGIEATNKRPNKTKRGRPYYIREPNELLIGRQNFHNGGIGIVPEDMKNYIASNAISTLELRKGSLRFFYYYLSNANFYKRVGHLIGGTGQKEISELEMKKLKLKIPKSLQEQKAIAQILSTADKEIDLLNQELEQVKLQKKGLMQLLLTGIIRVKS